MAKKNNLYLPKGYLNIPEISKMADKSGAAFIVILGARQVGKTFGVLQHMLREDRRFILMRRTKTEADFIAHGQITPFAGIDRSVFIKKASEYHSTIYRRIDDETDEPIGITLSLSTVSKIRGFSGADYTDLVFDEFIPESHVMKIKNEGDAFLNAVVTISGNREIEDKPPLRTWLLANSNNLASPILAALNLTEKIEQMSASGQELSVMPERGVVVVLPRSEQILAARKQTALMRAINKESSFSKMAFENKFSYNDGSNVRSCNLKEFRYLASVAGMFALYKHKAGGRLYCTNAQITGTYRREELQRFMRELPDVKPYYIANRIWFSSQVVKERFLEFMKI